MKRKFQIVTSVGLALLLTACAQRFNFSGTVLDSDEEPISGAKIFVVDTSDCCEAPEGEDGCEVTTGSDGKWSYKFTPEALKSKGEKDEDEEDDNKSSSVVAAVGDLDNDDDDEEDEEKQELLPEIANLSCVFQVSAKGYSAKTSTIDLCDGDGLCESKEPIEVETVLSGSGPSDD